MYCIVWPSIDVQPLNLNVSKTRPKYAFHIYPPVLIFPMPSNELLRESLGKIRINSLFGIKYLKCGLCYYGIFAI